VSTDFTFFHFRLEIKGKGLMKEIISMLVLFCLSLAAAEKAINIESRPMTGGGAIELGQMYGVDDLLHDEVGISPYWTLHRTIGWFTKQAVVNEKLTLTAGMGGLFYFVFPYNVDLGITNSRISAVSITELSAA